MVDMDILMDFLTDELKTVKSLYSKMNEQVEADAIRIANDIVAYEAFCQLKADTLHRERLFAQMMQLMTIIEFIKTGCEENVD